MITSRSEGWLSDRLVVIDAAIACSAELCGNDLSAEFVTFAELARLTFALWNGGEIS